MLAPEDRPTVPVRLYSKDEEFPNRNHATGAGAFVPDERDRIFVNKNAEEYKSWRLPLLAAVLGHEQVHVKQTEPKESPAYAKQLELLRLLNRGNVPKDYFTVIQDYGKYFADKEAKKGNQ